MMIRLEERPSRDCSSRGARASRGMKGMESMENMERMYIKSNNHNSKEMQRLDRVTFHLLPSLSPSPSPSPPRRSFLTNATTSNKPHKISAIAGGGGAGAGAAGAGVMHRTRTQYQAKLALVMVGLPFRGKSMLATRLVRYLTWMGYQTKVFATPKQWTDHLFILQSAVHWLDAEGGRVAIIDDYNATRKTRASIREILDHAAVDVLFIESYCNDEVVLEQIFATKMQTVKYSKMGLKEAKVELENRIAAIAAVYETMEGGKIEPNCPFIKVINQGQQIIMNLCWGYLPGQISLYLANQHTLKRKIWLSRHGESEYNLQDKLGGDSGLTLKGVAYSYALANYFNKQQELSVYTSTLIRTQQTIQHLSKHYTYHHTRLLNEIHAGAHEHMTYEEIKENFPEEYAERTKNKFHYRYPRGGESYVDLVERLKPYIIELERQRVNVLVVSHQAVLRVLLSYFLDDLGQSDCPTFAIPHNRIVELTPTAYGYQSKFIELDINPYLEKLKNNELPLGPAFTDGWRPPGVMPHEATKKLFIESLDTIEQAHAVLLLPQEEEEWVKNEWTGKQPESQPQTDI